MNDMPTRYYIITTEYAGTAPRENLDADRIEICTEPGLKGNPK